jgi:hypothetical protein
MAYCDMTTVALLFVIGLVATLVSTVFVIATEYAFAAGGGDGEMLKVSKKEFGLYIYS